MAISGYLGFAEIHVAQFQMLQYLQNIDHLDPVPILENQRDPFPFNPIAGIFQKLTGGYGPLQGPYEGESKTIHDGFAPSPPSLGCKSQNPIEITTTTITLFNYVI